MSGVVPPSDECGRAVLKNSMPLAIDRRDCHLRHQGGDVFATDLEALDLEHVAQHARPCEWVVQVQLIDTPHQH